MSGRRRRGIFSLLGVAGAVAVAAVVLAWSLGAGLSLFSPGALNAQAKGTALGGVTTHAQLARRCGACHTAPWSSGTMAGKCLVCHQAVAQEISGKSGVHANMGGTAAAADCQGCHPEHRGAAGALTALDAANFKHDLTGFSLQSHKRTAQGRAFACADCHTKGLLSFDQAICTQCHQQMDTAFMSRHVASFGSDCLACHDGSGGLGKNFDHSKTGFPLTGTHAKVPCGKCHTSATSSGGFKNTPADCYSCHAKDDAHNGTYGHDCGSCHTTTAWKPASFDHSVFPIDHGNQGATTPCQTCHPNGTSTYTCFGCHAHTQSNVVGQHEGQSLSQLTDCIRCHPQGRAGD
jgi:hypothetical protein